MRTREDMAKKSELRAKSKAGVLTAAVGSSDEDKDK
jgi:hypothetical protein